MEFFIYAIILIFSISISIAIIKIIFTCSITIIKYILQKIYKKIKIIIYKKIKIIIFEKKNHNFINS